MLGMVGQHNVLTLATGNTRYMSGVSLNEPWRGGSRCPDTRGERSQRRMGLGSESRMPMTTWCG